MRLCSADFLGVWAIQTLYARVALADWKSGYGPERWTRPLSLAQFPKTLMGPDPDLWIGLNGHGGPYPMGGLVPDGPAVAPWGTTDFVIPRAFDEDRGGKKAEKKAKKPYEIVGEGTALIHVDGAMMKDHPGKGNITSSREVTNQFILAERDPDVRGIVLRVDSPGGHVSGVDELASAIGSAARMKPVVAAVEDMAASAAFWAASQAQEIYINRMGRIGSLGAYAVVYDESKAFAAEGIKVHVVSTGEHKGAGVPGTAVTKEMLAQVQETVDAAGAAFKGAVAEGRVMRAGKMTAEGLDGVFDGRMFGSARAIDLGLVDGIGGIGEAVRRAEALAGEMDRRRAAGAAAARMRM